ncbi:MAG: hypothetical protein F4X99_11160 [Gammaproteobacteria bacterium]|nr:hypothetical protein [Gammaproteobacteria bacterium]
MRRVLAGVMVCCALVGSGEEVWRGLVVAPEFRCAPYDRSDYRYPRTVEEAIVRELGDLFGPYTCTRFGSTRDTEIEHMVALSEAHDSGLCAADPGTRRRFARELRNLTVAAPSINRSKGARDASEWLPESNRCWFAGRIVDVRLAYGLTIDRGEADALDAVLAGCPAGDMREPFCPAARSVLRFVLPLLRRADGPGATATPSAPR